MITCQWMFCTLVAQDLDLNPSYEYGFQGDTVTVSFYSNNFVDIGSFQFTLNWDASLVQYIDISSEFLGSIGVNENEVDQGLLRVSWFGLSDAVTISSTEAVFQVRFLTLGEPGDISSVFISGDPLAIEVLRLVNGVPEIVGISSASGAVEVLEDFLLVIENTVPPTCQNSNGSIEIGVSGGLPPYVFSWTGPDTFVSEEEDIDLLAGGIYEVIILDSLGHILMDTITLESQPNDLSFIGVTEQAYDCDDQLVTVELLFDGGDSPYSIEVNGEAYSDPIIDLSAGQHVVTIIDSSNCAIDTSFEIGSIPIPMIDLGDDVTACAGETVMLESAFQAEQYLWSTEEQTPSIEVMSEGVYALTVTNEQGCAVSDSVNVVFQLPFKAEVNIGDTTICPGESVMIEATGGTNYEWLDESETLSVITENTAMVSPVQTTTYGVAVSDECFEDTVYTQVIIGEVLADAGKDTSVFLGCEIELNAIGGIAYLWDSSTQMSCYECPNPAVIPEESTVYHVAITDALGCVFLDSVLVEVTNDINQLFRPVNVITPNNDGDNDFLWFSGLEKFPSNTLKIFNRWGNIVFQKVGYQGDDERFDGTYQGKPLPPGEYYYVLSVTSGEIKQTLLIVRD